MKHHLIASLEWRAVYLRVGLFEYAHGQFLGTNEHASMKSVSNFGGCDAGCAMIGDRMVGRVLTQTS